MKKPNFFIVGAPKCGTTAMNDYLNHHPDIFMAMKELHYFGSDLKTKVKITEAEYLHYFKNANNEKIVGEASVWYLFSEKAAEEIKAFSPEAKILIMLRNPVDVIHSLHSEHLYDGNEDVQDFETAINLDEKRKKGLHLPDAVDYIVLPPYLDSVLFYEQVKRYFDVFGRENVRIILYNDYIADTKKTVRKTLEFLQVNPELDIEYNVINANKKMRSFFLHRLLKKPPPNLKKIVRVILPFKNWRHKIMSFLFKRNVHVKRRSQMSEQLNAQLKKSVAEDVILLGELIKKDLTGWLR